jgi:hypothetical protein
LLPAPLAGPTAPHRFIGCLGHANNGRGGAALGTFGPGEVDAEAGFHDGANYEQRDRAEDAEAAQGRERNAEQGIIVHELLRRRFLDFVAFEHGDDAFVDVGETGFDAASVTLRRRLADVGMLVLAILDRQCEWIRAGLFAGLLGQLVQFVLGQDGGDAFERLGSEFAVAFGRRLLLEYTVDGPGAVGFDGVYIAGDAGEAGLQLRDLERVREPAVLGQVIIGVRRDT